MWGSFIAIFIKSPVEVPLAISMVDKNKPLGKVEKVFTFLFLASIALIPIGIAVMLQPPPKTTNNFSLAPDVHFQNPFKW